MSHTLSVPHGLGTALPQSGAGAPRPRCTVLHEPHKSHINSQLRHVARTTGQPEVACPRAGRNMKSRWVCRRPCMCRDPRSGGLTMFVRCRSTVTCTTDMHAVIMPCLGPVLLCLRVHQGGEPSGAGRGQWHLTRTTWSTKHATSVCGLQASG